MSTDNYIRVVLVASGNGTDASAVMSAFKARQLIVRCQVVALLSTKPGAGCLQLAEGFNIPTHVIARQGKSEDEFASEITRWLTEGVNVQLVFLLGCIHKMPVPPGIRMYNIHPADPHRHGGDKMYGLVVHQHVLTAILDEIGRGQSQLTDRFFTYPTVHEVTADYDQGLPLLIAPVEIPTAIISTAQVDLAYAATQLQKLVLPCEHLMLPVAVNLACQRLLVQS